MDYADLEIAIHRRGLESYNLELRFTPPGSEADIRILREGTAALQLDFAELLALANDPLAYGQALSRSLFESAGMQQAFTQAYTLAQAEDLPLRVRLYLNPSAQELHSLRWETICHPEDQTPLLTRPDFIFSRYLSSRDWRPVRARSRGQLSALAVVANPENLAGYKLAPIDVDAFHKQITAAFDDIPHTALVARGQATLDNIVAHLLGGVDILYLVCHATLVKGESQLHLEDADGKIATTAGSALAAILRDQSHRPRLVVLAACQTADAEDTATTEAAILGALGPTLAEAGIPAVIAMNGRVSTATTEQFMGAFFTELLREGQVDRAVSVARGVIRDRPDSWMPVLFMRLKNGQLWYAPSFADDKPDRRGRAAEKWPVIVQSIRNRTCTPIIGPDMAESLFGTRQDLAWRLAHEHKYPLDPHDLEGLPQVAQYLAVNFSPAYLPESLVRYLVQGIRKRYHLVPAELAQVAAEDNVAAAELSPVLDQLVNLAWTQRRAQAPVEPYGLLASLPLSVYITTDQVNLLASALREAGKEPQIRLAPWNEDILRRHSLVDVVDEPDPQRPLVYHLFGNLQQPYSLVLTEDDFFDYLIGITRNTDRIPSIVRERLSDSALLFLGFRMEDWYFRVFYRILMDTLSGRRRRHHAHVAVQIAPEEDRLLDPQRARRYLEEYFQHADISIYWGSAEDFMQEFELHWKRGRL